MNQEFLETTDQRLSRGLKPTAALLIIGAIVFLSACAYYNTHPLVKRPVFGPSFPRPEHTDTARLARWLVHECSWGVLSTVSRHLNGIPFGNVVSYADGPASHSTGRLLFYLTRMDSAAYDAEVNATVSFAIAEASLEGACTRYDPEDPPCSKITVSGKLLRVPDTDVDAAKALLFPRHPAMEQWPRGHAFQLYELEIDTIQLLAWYGGPKMIPPSEYFAAVL